MSSLYELGLSVPWHMTTEALAAMLSIAARDPMPEEEIRARMHGARSLASRAGQRREDSRRMTTRDGVAVIAIDGPIYRYADFFTAVSGGVTTESLMRDVGAALADPAVQAVLFVIDSPGGEVTGINELADAIYAARGRKPIGAYIEGFGASAAYWIASAADVVWVDDTARVGSIGTVMGVPDPSKIASRTIEFVSSQSPKKRADPTTDQGRAYFQTMVDQLTEVFLAKVARNRNRPVRAFAELQGGLLIGQAAVKAGLADALGSEEGAIQALVRGQWQPARRAAQAAPARPAQLTDAQLLSIELQAAGERQRVEAERAHLQAEIAQFHAAAEQRRIEADRAAEQQRLQTAQAAELAQVEANARRYAAQRNRAPQASRSAPAAPLRVGDADPDVIAAAESARRYGLQRNKHG